MRRHAPIPLVDLQAQYAEVGEVVEADLRRLLREGSYIGGHEVSSFEAEYAEFVSAAHCVGVGNGTDALELSLRAVGVGAGDEVVLPANTFVATAEAVVRIGAVPVLVDVVPDTLLIDPALVPESLTRRTRAVIPVHLYGQAAPVEQIEEVLGGTSIHIVEDAAQSQGASRRGKETGALGQVAATSFYPGKNLGAAGDAGAVTTDDSEIAQRVRLLANHGSAAKYEHEVVG
jgi:dTDP-4-amino-4,6-dideoxygalactose transaminase